MAEYEVQYPLPVHKVLTQCSVFDAFILLYTKFWLRNFPCDWIFLCSPGTDNLLHAITNTYDWAALALKKKLNL